MRIIETKETTYRPMFASADVPLTVATVENEGYTFTFSHRADDEPGEWYCDALIAPSGFVHWSHGEGDRTCAKRPAYDECKDMLNAMCICHTSHDSTACLEHPTCQGDHS